MEACTVAPVEDLKRFDSFLLRQDASHVFDVFQIHRGVEAKGDSRVALDSLDVVKSAGSHVDVSTLAEVKVRIGLTIGPCWLHFFTAHKGASDVVQEENLRLCAQNEFQSIKKLA